jgi:hypothetical protein
MQVRFLFAPTRRSSPSGGHWEKELLFVAEADVHRVVQHPPAKLERKAPRAGRDVTRIGFDLDSFGFHRNGEPEQREQDETESQDGVARMPKLWNSSFLVAILSYLKHDFLLI